MLSRIVANNIYSELKTDLRNLLVNSQNAFEPGLYKLQVQKAIRACTSEQLPEVCEHLSQALASDNKTDFQLNLNNALFALAHVR